jgi:hypothetical protein
MKPINQIVLEMFLPKGTLEWFEIVDGVRDENVHITLEEKNIPPITEELKDKKIISKGFYDITITDFPARDRKLLLTFRRRRWQVEGQKELLKRDIQLTLPGTQLDVEFANFLKEAGRNDPDLVDYYSEFI